MQIKNVTFIGLGVMGYNMAGHLKKNNFNTTVYNRTSSVSEKWVNEFGGASKKTPGKRMWYRIRLIFNSIYNVFQSPYF